jgi:small membrane protein
MHAIQIVLVCFAVFAMSRVFVRFRRGGMRAAHLGLWGLFWTLVVVAALRPETTDLFARWLGVGRGVDTAMYLSFLTIFYLVFRLFTKLEDLDRQLTRVVRANAIKDAEAQLTATDSGNPSTA